MNPRWALAASLLVVVALFGIWNEIRYQGCIQRTDGEYLVNATAKRPILSPPVCHRIPFRH